MGWCNRARPGGRSLTYIYPHPPRPRETSLRRQPTCRQSLQCCRVASEKSRGARKRPLGARRRSCADPPAISKRERTRCRKQEHHHQQQQQDQDPHNLTPASSPCRLNVASLECNSGTQARRHAGVGPSDVRPFRQVCGDRCLSNRAGSPPQVTTHRAGAKGSVFGQSSQHTRVTAQGHGITVLMAINSPPRPTHSLVALEPYVGQGGVQRSSSSTISAPPPCLKKSSPAGGSLEVSQSNLPLHGGATSHPLLLYVHVC